jgi:hypothetical protein
MREAHAPRALRRPAKWAAEVMEAPVAGGFFFGGWPWGSVDQARGVKAPFGRQADARSSAVPVSRDQPVGG